MDIYLIRHGMTAGNSTRRYIGRTDDPLCPEGERAAQSRGSFPALSRVFVTPLLRTRQTAAILFPNARQIVVDGLREMDFGDFENHNADEMADDPDYRAWVKGNCLGPCPGGEDISAFSDRVCAAFSETMRREKASERAVFVVHGGTIMAVMNKFSDQKRSYFEWSCKNCGGFSASLFWDGDTPVLKNCRMLEALEF